MNRILISIAAGCLVTACTIEGEVNLFVADVLQVAGGGDPVMTTMLLSIDTSTVENCQKHSDAVTTALAKGFETVEFVGCRAGTGFAHFADFKVGVPITSPDLGVNGALAVWVQQDGTTTLAVLKPNDAVVAQIRAALPPELNNDYMPKPRPVISTRLQNDLAGAATVSMQGVFIDGEPFQLLTERVLQRRNEVSIKLSDVGNAAFDNGGSVLLLLSK